MRKVSTGIALLLCLYVLITWTNLALVYSRPLFVASNPQKSDVILLFSSGVIDANWLTVDAAQRTWGALQLYREGFAPRIISSGSFLLRKQDQASLQARWLERAGVPADAITVENRSTRTYESVREIIAIMRSHGWRSAVASVSQLDVPRIRSVFHKLDPSLQVSYLAAPEFDVQNDGPLFIPQGTIACYHATYEYAALVLYRFKGWI